MSDGAWASTSSGRATPPPAKLLRLAIQKRRSLLAAKDSPLREQLLLSATIEQLCRHIGEARAAKRAANDVAAPGLVSAKRRRLAIVGESPPPSGELSASQSSSRVLREAEEEKEEAGRSQTSAEVPLDDRDPFGLDSFFASLKGVQLR